MKYSKITLSSLIFIVALYNPLSSAFAASLVSTVDRSKIGLNQTILLTVRLDQQVGAASLNVQALETDFEVLEVSPLTSTSVSVINGKTTQTATTDWKIRLAPKREGLLTVPALSIDGAQSKPISILVEATDSRPATEQPLSVTIQASEKEAYTQQQIILTIKLTAQSDVSSFSGAPLSLGNAEIKELGQKEYNRIDNGILRQIVELKYALFAKEAGTLEIPAMTFNAVKGAQRSFFMSRNGERVIARSKPLTVTIKEPPTSTHSWLPSEQVDIRAELLGDQSQLKVGTPITRKITISAAGQTAEAIPPITNTDGHGGDGFKSYSDKPQLFTEVTADGLLSTRVESAAIVPSAAGQIVLPEVRVNWWDVARKQWQEAVLPATTLSVSAADVTVNDTAPDIDSQSGNEANSIAETNPRDFVWQAVSALLLLVCIAQYWMFKRSSSGKRQKQSNIDHPASESLAWKNLEVALRQGEPNEIRKRLLSWAYASSLDKKTITLTSLANNTESNRLSSALSKLESHLYGGKNLPIEKNDLKELYEALLSLRRETKRDSSQNAKARQNSLRPLYPN